MGKVSDTSTFSWELGKDSSLYSTRLVSVRYEATSSEPRFLFFYLYFLLIEVMRWSNEY